ncbi:hypothetical protein AN641_06155 [Candidatus Epulonipiscioides gigas]|nr:hypothetical protein AN641_06155 [Epulopiscium sp. SCG-C07WGA-EpuloA2]
MKLRQKLAMVMTATMVATSIPVTTSAISVSVDKESMTSHGDYNKYGYYQEEPGDLYPKSNNAINLKIINNDNDKYPMDDNDLPAIFTIQATDIEFKDELFQETEKDLDGYITQYDMAKSMTDFIEPTSLKGDFFYALPDESAGNDRNLAINVIPYKEHGANTEGPGGKEDWYPHRLFTIDKDGNYTSYVSIAYAYSAPDGNQWGNYKDYLDDTDDDIYIFSPTFATDNVSKATDRVYVNMISDGNDSLIENSGEPEPIAKYENLQNEDWNKYDKFFSEFYEGGTGTRAYIKEYTLYKDQYGDDKTLEVELYQQIGTTNEQLERLYIPLAFKITGKKPSIKTFDTSGIFTTQWAVELFSNGEVVGDMVALKSKNEGQLSIDGRGDLGTFELEETLSFVFDGAFEATSDVEEDFNEGTGGRLYYLQLNNSDLEFDLKAGDRYWDEKPVFDENDEEWINDGEKGTLAQYINMTGGFRGYEEYVQIEVLGVDEQEMVIRIIDESITAERERKYQGGIEFSQLPIELKSRNEELKAGDLELMITEVELDNFEFDGDDGVNGVEFDDANTLDEDIVIAEITDDELLIDVLESVELWAGQGTDTIELELKEMIVGAVNERDEFYIKFENGHIAQDFADIEFNFEDGSIDNKDLEIFYSEDEEEYDEEDILGRDNYEYVLDLDKLFDICVDQGYLDKDDKNVEEDWHEILQELTFKVEVGAYAYADEGDMKLIIESDNIMNDEKILVVGTVKKTIKIDAESISVDLGVKEQKKGKIVITEAEEEMLTDGNEILIALDGLDIRDANVKTDDKSELSVDAEVVDNILKIEITEESDGMPGTITIEDMEFDIWAGTPKGGYDMFIGGNALDFKNQSYSDMVSDNKLDEDEIVEYISEETVSMAKPKYLYVGDGAEKSQIKTVVDFRAGTTTVNGVKVAMTSRPYITSSGWSMIGIRDLATFFGIDENQIAFSHDDNNVMTVTITNGKIGAQGSTLVTLRNGSKLLNVNGTERIMEEAMTIGSDSRAYAPIRPIAEALGLTVSWNPATNVATFAN